MVAGPVKLGILECKQDGCCSCSFTGGSKVVAGPGLLGTLGSQKGAVGAVLDPLENARPGLLGTLGVGCQNGAVVAVLDPLENARS